MNETETKYRITTLFKYDTEYSADSVEWCPHEPHQNIFVCGTYQLKETEEKQNKRLGRIYLFSVTTDELKLLQQIDTPAILDQKWCHNKIGDYSILGVVNAKNTLEIYRLKEASIKLELVTKYTLEGDDLLLSLDWSCGKYENQQPFIACSNSKGTTHIFRFNGQDLIYENEYKGHDFEAWITGFYYWDPNIFFSGGDDSIFLKFDQRVGVNPISKNRSHDAGVTSIHSNTKNEFSLCTGSYDESIRLWDIRRLKEPQVSLKMPGPIWRLKWDPFYHSFLLAACMLGGVHIIDTKPLEIVGSYYEHKNISYGADWSHAPMIDGDTALIGTCSFYDHLLCVSKIKFID